jgi:hypothetical protein
MKERWRAGQGLFLCILTILLIGLTGHGAVTVTLLSPEKEVGAGEFVTHVFAIFNDSVTPSIYELNVDLPSDWTLLEAPKILALDPKQEEVLFATAIVSPRTAAGDYTMHLSVTSQTVPSDQAEVHARVRVKPVNAVEIIAPSGDRVTPGQDLVYSVTVINRGNAQDTFEMTATSSNRLPVHLSQDLISLTPQERTTVEVRLSVPLDFPPGPDSVTIEVTSRLYPGVTAVERIPSTILPPPPQAVGRTLLEVLPARIRISLSHEITSSLFRGDFAFSFSGRVEEGVLSFSLNASPLFGPDPLEITSFSIQYRRSPMTFSIGNVSTGLTNLLSLSCQGGSVFLDMDWYDLLFIAGEYGQKETRTGGRLTLGPNVANVGIVYMDLRTQTDQSAVWSMIAKATPLEEWSLELEGGLGFENNLTSHAVFFGTTVNTRIYFLRGEAFSVGSYFPGSRRDQAGFTLSQRLRQERFSLSLSLGHTWTNVIRDPAVPTRLDDKLGLNLSVTPFEIGPTLSVTTEFAWNRRDDPALESAVTQLFAGTLADRRGDFPYSFSGRISDQIDHIAGTHFRTLSFSEEVGLVSEGFNLSLGLSQERREDYLTGEILSGGSDVSFTFNPKGSLHTASLRFSNNEDRFMLTLQLGIQILKDFDVGLRGTRSWDRDDATPATLRLDLDFNVNFDLPIPFLLTKGQIEGRAFIDEDENGRFNIGDQEASEIVVAAQRSEISTDTQGFFRFPPFYPGRYELEVRNLPFDAAPPKIPVSVELDVGKRIFVNLPLVPVLYIEGKVFNDTNQDGALTEGEGGFEQVFINLAAEDGTTINAYTGQEGRFRFLNILPGQYTLSLDLVSLPSRFSFSTPEKVTLRIVGDPPPPVLFGGYIKPKEVVITFQPPTADFVVRPDQPIAGQPATFDASESFALIGEIESYEWDFDNDGLADATGARAPHVFPSPGLFDVSLTVVDDSGNSDTIIRTVEVRK